MCVNCIIEEKAKGNRITLTTIKQLLCVGGNNDVIKQEVNTWT